MNDPRTKSNTHYMNKIKIKNVTANNNNNKNKIASIQAFKRTLEGRKYHPKPGENQLK